MTSKSFPQYFNDHISRVNIVPKSSSSFMKQLGGLLHIATTFGITNISKEQFLTQYTTTIGSTIYSDELTMESAPSSLLIHELCHVLQFTYRQMPFEYIVSVYSRAYYESEATQATMVCFPHDFYGSLEKWDEEFVSRRVEHLIKYGIPRRVANLAIRDRIIEVQHGKIPERPRQMKASLDAWRNS
jgi:hypothetical protein